MSGLQVVTGAAGFIGSNITRALRSRGATDILAVDVHAEPEACPNSEILTGLAYMEMNAFREALPFMADEVEAISHQGACADTMVTDERFMMERNLEYSKALLEVALERSIPFVYASSASVYGVNADSREVPGNENPLNVYARSKLAFDEHVREVTGGARSTVVGLRYFNVYGPGEAHKGRMASMPYQLWRQLAAEGVCRLFEGTDGYADGEQRRDFVFVGDVADVNLHFLNGPVRQGILNVGTGASRAFNDVARALIGILGGGRIEYVPFPESLAGKYQSFTEADISALREAGCVGEFTSLEDGLAASVPEWGS